MSSCWHRWRLQFKYTPTHTALYLGPYLLLQSGSEKLKIMLLHFIFSEVIFNWRSGKAFASPQRPFPGGGGGRGPMS